MSSTPLLSSTQIYLVRDGHPVTLEIVIGDLQAGGTSIIWDHTIVDFPPNPQPFVLTADGTTARTRTLHCTTRVRDVNPNTNRTSVTYKLRGGMQDKDYPFMLMVPNEHDFADYVVDFVFI